MTQPLTPVDCDLRDFAFMPLDVMRLMDSDLFALSTGDEFKASIALWCKSWQQVPAGSLPDDDRVLAHLSGAGPRWKKLKAMALRNFVKCDDGRLYHSMVCEKANEAWGKKQSYRERSKKGNSKRWGSQKDEQQHSLSDPLGTAEGVLEPPKGEGEGQGDYSVTKVTGTVVPLVDPQKRFWDMALTYLGEDKRSLIGKWLKAHGRDEVAAALGAAQAAGVFDPVPWIEARFKAPSADAMQPWVAP